MSEKGPTLGRDPSLSREREQRSEGRLMLASVRNFKCAAYATRPQSVISERRQGTLVWESRAR
jgi:hypothetical protein